MGRPSRFSPEVRERLGRHHLPHSAAPRAASFAQSRGPARRAYPSLCQTGPWASRAGRREVPHAPRASRAANPSRPVHGRSMMPLGCRALRVYRRHTPQNAIAFADDVILTFPFRLHTVRTDRGHACQALFHWHLADQGIQHVYIKPRTPQLNGDSRAFPSHGSAGVLSAPERQGRCRSGATAGRVGALLQLRSAPRSIRRADPVRSTPRTVTVMMATVPRDPSHHTPWTGGGGHISEGLSL